jgi:uncharacterized protein
MGVGGRVKGMTQKGFQAISMGYGNGGELFFVAGQDMVTFRYNKTGSCYMSLRERLQTALKEAMKAREVERLSTLRLVNAAIKDRDIASRGDGGDEQVGDGDILAILGKMVKQRQESARAYEEGGRLELAEKELAEIKVIEDYLPRQLTEAEVEAAIAAAVAAVGAASIRDMGRVMAELKGKYTGQMDFGAVGPRVKEKLG